MTNVPTAQLEATVGSMNIIKAIRRHPPLIPPAYTVVGVARAKTALFYEKYYKRRSRDCKSLRMMLSVPGRVPAPVVGVNDAFLRQ